MRRAFCLLIGVIVPVLAVAQPAKLITEFPAAAMPLNQGDITKTFTGKTSTFTAADGFKLRTQFKANGFFFFNTSTGGQGSGTWALRESKICTKVQGDPQESCSEVRRDGERVVLKRASNGEVVELKLTD